MNRITIDELEAGVRDVFEQRAQAITPSNRSWDDTALATVGDLTEHRNRKRWVSGAIAAVAIAGVAAVALIVVGVGGSGRITTKNPPTLTQPNASTPTVRPVAFKTNVVDFRAGTFTIVANGQTFTAPNAEVAVHSDAGTADYWTLELTWNEHGVEMRMNIYFQSDGRDWWANEIRTYNGKAEGDWIYYEGTFFKTPLGQPFTGDLDLTGKATGDQLHIKNLQLTVNPARFDCSGGTGTLVVSPDFDGVFTEMPAGSTGLANHMNILDKATCAKVANAAGYTIRWTSDNAKVVKVTQSNCSQIAGDCAGGQSVDVSDGVVGTTTVHATVVDSRGKVVGTTDFAAKVTKEGNLGGGSSASVPAQTSQLIGH